MRALLDHLAAASTVHGADGTELTGLPNRGHLLAGAIAGLIVPPGKPLGSKAIAEGVENDGQFAFLSRQACDACKGFLFAPPLPLGEFERRFAAASLGSATKNT